MTNHSEFPDYALSDLPAMPEGFADSSWHNDTCPSFIDEAHRLRIFIDYVDKAKRELPDGMRFTVAREQFDGAITPYFSPMTGLQSCRLSSRKKRGSKTQRRRMPLLRYVHIDEGLAPFIREGKNWRRD